MHDVYRFTRRAPTERGAGALLPASVAVALAATLFMIPAAFAATDGDVVRGEAAYVENCASCHASAARIMRRVTGDDDVAKAAGLDEFLAGHYAEDPQDRADIIAYMLSL